MEKPQLVNMWILASDRDRLKVTAAQQKKTMYQIIHELVTLHDDTELSV